MSYFYVHGGSNKSLYQLFISVEQDYYDFVLH